MRFFPLLLLLLASTTGARPAGSGSGAELQLPLRSVGPAGMSGRITSIAVTPHDRDVWYVGAASGGLWKTENGGTTFDPVFDGQPVQSIGAVAVAPSNPDVVYAGTGEGNPRNSQSSGAGLFKSYDGGRSWQAVGLEASRNIHRIVVHPQDEDTLWVGVLGDPFADGEIRGLYKSTDGGASWRRVLYANPRSGVADLVMDPKNPNKLFAALWEFRRTPWDFTSGGDGSGLFLSHDGGESWKALDEAAGLPEKPWGRIGIAIAPSQRDRVYALVESRDNALYRSDDGGASWTRINSDTIGNRPFYFAELYVDTQNENRVYNLYSRLARSEDGGESFAVIEDWGREVHADYQAFWIDPQDSDFIIAGTDGGLYWTRDRGANWRFAENLPLGQFYHVTVDDALPYNVYGGLQDNGTWFGPSEVWNRAGLRNAYWREIAFNDGFDVVLNEEDSTAYALWQAGMLVRVNLDTGQRKTVAPATGPEPLRFNWNAAIARDPFAAGTIYIGSQYLHRSRDRGDSWEIISPDLTTNDPARQQQTASGGLSIDATGAENHTTITAIGPSSVEEGLIWVGSDDGRLHLTRDGGERWTDLSGRLGVAPDAGWIRQVVPSSHAAAEAFVVIDNHLQGDWTPYLFHTRDFGRSWTNLLEGQNVAAYALAIAQDPVESALLFAGTEFGLYVSLDRGATWSRWTRGFPAVSTMDLAIQPREGDLVVGTFGRSIWILDDLGPWRALARRPALTAEALHIFAPADAYQVVMDQARGQRLSPDHLYSGDNNAREAPITFWVGDASTATVTVAVEQGGERLREWEVAVQRGLNRTYWDLQLEGHTIYGPLMSPDLEMPLAPPGRYDVVVETGDELRRATLQLRPDPRVVYDPEVFAANLAYRRNLEVVKNTVDDAARTLACFTTVLEAAHAIPANVHESLVDGIDGLWKQLDYPDIQGTVSDSPRLAQRLARAWYFNHSPYEPVSSNDRALLDGLQAQSAGFERAFETFVQRTWADAASRNLSLSAGACTVTPEPD